MKAEKEGWLRCTVTDGGHIRVAETFRLGVHTWKGCKDKLREIVRKHYLDHNNKCIFHYCSEDDEWYSLNSEKKVLSEISRSKEHPLTIEVISGLVEQDKDYTVVYTVWLADADTPYDKKKAAELVMVGYEED